MLRSGFSFILLLLLTTFTPSAPASEPQWSRFRGPNGLGVATDTDIPVKFSERSVLWKKAIPGSGNSSPVLWGNRIFLQSASKDGKERMLLCLSSLDGKIIWNKSFPTSPGLKPKTHPKNSLASATPAVDGERVYALFWDGVDMQLFGLDMEGKQLWQRNLGPVKSQHGPGTSPMVYQKKVYVANDQDGEAELLAFDALTGKDVWRAKRQPFRACYSVPFLLEKPEMPTELIVGSTAGLTSYDPDTGHENWNWTTWPFAKMALRTVASPLATDGMIIANSGDGSGERNTVAIRPQGKGTLSNEVVLWSKIKSYPYVPNLLALGEHLYFVNDGGFAGCAVARTGEILWLERLGGNFSASPILIDGKVYAASEEGTVYVFQAAPKFQLLAKNVLDEGIIATPAVAGHRLFIRGRNSLYCFGDVSTSAR
ncbi:MAG TPA: PQQ-binding-like beta-propeller repeat protein [Gemmataceae bacterium]|jgi:outer membrane protein assembly factor BamB|nr:PQQ-binding-like beta-propeller repeat protein [Gemmataceae bacterium]